MEYTPNLEKRVQQGKNDNNPQHDVMKLRIKQTQVQFEKDAKTAQKVEFNFYNPVTKCVEKGQMVIMESEHPLTSTNLGYAHFGKNTIMAIYAGKDRKHGDQYDIGVTPEAGPALREVMKQIVYEMNVLEQKKYEEISTNPKRSKDEQDYLDTTEKSNDRPMYKEGDKQVFGPRRQNPIVLVGLNSSLVAAANNSCVSKGEWEKCITTCINKLNSNTMLRLHTNTGRSGK